MALKTTLNEYSQTNYTMTVSSDLKKIHATSYQWWVFITTDSVGNIIFNDSRYSNSTSNHQSDCMIYLRRLGIEPDLILRGTTESMHDPYHTIKSEIEFRREEVKGLIKGIKKKGSWKSKNAERKLEIAEKLFRIKDLRRFKNENLDKKKVESKRKLKSFLNKEYQWEGDLKFGMNKHRVKAVNGLKKLYFKKDSGKYDYQGLTAMLNKIKHGGGAPTDTTKLKTLLGLKKENLETLLVYQFTQDTNNMIPNIDSKEYRQLQSRVKSLGITQGSLTPLDLDKIHTYLTNKMNRKSYVPSEPETVPVHPVLIALESRIKDLEVVKTVQDLKKEGRQQGHCIGSKSYVNQVKQGFQAFRFKGHTFFLSPDLKLLEAHGRHNGFTPDAIKSEIMGEIQKSL